MRSLVRSVGLFSVVPVPSEAELTRDGAVAALRWLPLVGAGLGAGAALPLVAVERWAAHGVAVGAVIAVALLALLTRGLHLDGLADTADGLGSRAEPERALEIMRRSDIGPFGVITVVLVLLLDVAAVASVADPAHRWRVLAALAVAGATGRVAVLLAAHRSVPSARASGFGAYVARSVGTPVLVAWVVVVLALGAVLGWADGAAVIAWPVAQAAALVLGTGFLAHVVRRIGGVSGDVFGALVELVTALTLAGLALAT